MSKFQITVLVLLGLIACTIFAGLGLFSAYFWNLQEGQQAQVNQQQITIMPTATPEPTPVPPTFTPVPTPIPENIKLYVIRVRDVANTYIDESTTIYDLADYSQYQSDAWIAEITTHINRANSLYVELNNLTPPSELETFHRDLYLAMGYCQEAFSEIRLAIDLRDNIGEATNKMESAAKLSSICNDRLNSVDRSKYFEYRNNVIPSEDAELLYLNDMTELANDIAQRLDTLGVLFLDPKFDQPWVDSILSNTALLHSDYEIAKRYTDNNAVPEKFQIMHHLFVDALRDCDQAATLIEDAFTDNWLNNLDNTVAKMDEATNYVLICGEELTVATAELETFNDQEK